MVIGGIASNLTSTDAYFTIKPFLVNAKIEQGFPFQLQTKVLLSAGQSLQGWASNTLVSMAWEFVTEDEWNSDNPAFWLSEGVGDALVLLDLTIAEI